MGRDNKNKRDIAYQMSFKPKHFDLLYPRVCNLNFVKDALVRLSNGSQYWVDTIIKRLFAKLDLYMKELFRHRCH